MCRDSRDSSDAQDHIEDAELDRSDSSRQEFSNAAKYVPTRAGSPIRVLEKTRKRAAQGLREIEKYISG